MGDAYTAIGQQTVIATPDSMLGVTQPSSTSGVRGRVFEWTMGTTGTASDDTLLYTIQRTTAIGTGSTPTIEPLDTSAPTNNLTARDNYTVEPTTGDALMDFPLNVRATFRWVAYPGRELMIPNTNSAGIVNTPAQATGSYVGDCSSTVYWEE